MSEKGAVPAPICQLSPFFFNYGAYISGTSFSTYFSATLRPNVPVNYSFDDTIVLDGVVATGYDIYGHAVVGSVTDPIVTHGLSHSTTFYFTFDVETGIGTYYFDGGSFFVSDAII